MHRLALAACAALPLLLGCGQDSATNPGPDDARTVLVTGATGTQGGAVARELLARGYTVRALTRNPAQPAAQALVARGAEVRQGDYDDPASLVAAMDGMHGVFAVTDFWEHGFEAEVTHGMNLVAAAEDAGVRHFVFSSVAGADADTGLAHFDSKQEIEQIVRDSNLGYTIFRPVEFMDNWRYSIDDLRAGRFRDPRDPRKRHQWIAAADIGFFVAEAFDDPDHWIGRTEAIAGDELTLNELTRVMSDVFGRPVEHVQVPWADWEQSMGEEIAAMYLWFAEDGYTVNIEALRGRYPDLETVPGYLRELARDGDES